MKFVVSQLLYLVRQRELRGRALQNLRDLDGARNDWRAMLLLAPDYVFPVEDGPRALALFEEVRASTVGMESVASSLRAARAAIARP